MKFTIQLAVALLGFAGASQAATFTAFSQFERALCEPTVNVANGQALSGCDVAVTDSVGAIRTFRSQARAEPGSLGVEGSFSLDASVSRSAQQNSNLNTVSASFVDELFFGVSSGVLRLSVDVAGTQSATYAPGFGGAASRSDVIVNVGTNTVYRRTLTDSAAPTDIVQGSIGVSEVFLPFTGGVLTLSASMGGSFDCFVVSAGNSCSAVASFFNSLRFVGGSVLNEDGQIVETTVTSSSGFDYLVGLEPHDPPGPSVVPLPASMWMLGIGLAGLAGLRRRYSRQSD